MYPSEPFPHFVDDYLAYLYEVCPTQATLDGTHLHDDLLEDLSRPGDRRPRPGVIRIRPAPSSDRLRRASRQPSGSNIRIVASNIEARMFEFEEVRTWERNPQMYADTDRHEPRRTGAVRLRARGRARAAASCRSCGRCRGLCRRPATTSRNARASSSRWDSRAGAASSSSSTPICPRAFSSLDDLHILGDLADTSTEASHADQGLHRLPRNRSRAAGEGLVPPRARQVREEAEARGRHHAQRGSAAGHRASRAARGAGGIPLRREPVERRRRDFRPPGAPRTNSIRRRGSSCKPRRSRSRSWRSSSSRQSIVTLPRGRAGRRRADAGVLPVDVCVDVDAGPVRNEAKPRVLLPDRRRSQLAARAPGRAPARTSTSRRSGTSRFTRCIRATSCTSSICARSSRRSASRSFFAPASFVEGWAHYCEQMMIEAGFRRNDPTIKLGQLAEALVRLGAVRRRASACTARTCRSSRGCASSATRRFSRKRRRGAKPSAGRSIRPISCTRWAS